MTKYMVSEDWVTFVCSSMDTMATISTGKTTDQTRRQEILKYVFKALEECGFDGYLTDK